MDVNGKTEMIPEGVIVAKLRRLESGCVFQGWIPVLKIRCAVQRRRKGVQTKQLDVK
jgi:hypothetical protein